MNVYASEETVEAISNGRPPSHRAKVIQAGKELQVGGWQVMPFNAVHDAEGTLGFVIAGPTGKCVYLTDSAYSKHRFQEVTHFAIECNYSREILREHAMSGVIHHELGKRIIQTHMSLERLIEMLKANDLSRVQEIWLLHLSDTNSNEKEFKDAVQRATGKPVYVAGA